MCINLERNDLLDAWSDKSHPIKWTETAMILEIKLITWMKLMLWGENDISYEDMVTSGMEALLQSKLQ